MILPVRDALLIVDVQRALLDELPPKRSAEFVATLAPVLERARARNTPVIFVRHDGSPHELVPESAEWQIADEISPRDGEPIVDKRSADAFAGTTLADVLSERQIDGLVVTGMQSDVCVDATIREARSRGFRVMLVADAHATSAMGDKTETEIHAELHRDAVERGIRIVRAAECFPVIGA